MLSTQATHSSALKNYLTPDVPRVDTKKQSRQCRPELVAITQGSCFKDWKEKPINTNHSIYFPRKVTPQTTKHRESLKETGGQGGADMEGGQRQHSSSGLAHSWCLLGDQGLLAGMLHRNILVTQLLCVPSSCPSLQPHREVHSPL